MKNFLFASFSLTLLLMLARCSSPDLDDPAVQDAIRESKNLGLAYLEENRLIDAENEFQKLIDLNPNDPAGHANLGIVHLRAGNFEGAEKSLLKASSLLPDDPDISLSLAVLYEQTDRTNLSRQILEQSLTNNPDHVQTLYKRAQLYADDTQLLSNYISNLEAVIQYAPANIVPRFYLIEALAQAGKLETALFQLMDLRQQIPAIPREAQPHFEAAVSVLQNQDADASIRSSRIFHNLMKATPYYQTSLRLLGLRTDAAAGTPLISDPGLFSTSTAGPEASTDILEGMAFSNATEGAGFPNPASNTIATASALLDYNGDNEVDVFLAYWDLQRQATSVSLYESKFGRFTNVTESAGIIPSSSKTLLVVSFDFDNDTFLDLYIINEGPDQLYKNNGDGTFDEINDDAGLEASNAITATAADLDHDGDLDLFVGRSGPDLVYRNNADGSFTDISVQSGLNGNETPTRDVDFGDFDDDGDLDLLISRGEGLHLYLNQQQGVFRELASPQPFTGLTDLKAAAVADHNNDGFLDLFTASNAGLHLFMNQGDGQFQDSEGSFSDQKPGDVTDAIFFDVDNDGFQDLYIASAQPLLFHNNGSAGFEDKTSVLLPALDATPLAASFNDYNADRDLDLFLRTSEGIEILRNDGGHQNRLISIQTRGLVNNNSKNNYYSIGAKIEVRAGDLYQTQVVTQPVTYFGLGKRVQADVIRIVFTNGVPQNIFRPGTDQDIIEQQILKGSCPFLYTWNGSSFEFATDILWRSALGMPLGIMATGKASERQTAYAPAAIAEDYVMIPPGMLKENAGSYKIKITGELWETPYLDEIKLHVIDHPENELILIDEKFGPPPSGALSVYTIQKTIPVKGRDHTDQDISSSLKEADQQFVTPLGTTRYQGMMDIHTMTLTPAGHLNPKKAVLYLKGWVFPTDASINVALSQSNAFTPISPHVQVLDRSGRWVTVIPNMGFPMGKNKTVRVDLSNKFLSDSLSVRLVTNMQIYWDQAFFAEEKENTSREMVRSTNLSPASADLHYRGFSRLYRTSPFGPHLFDHDSVSTAPQWLDLEGRYTRYGDVTPLLQETNDQYVIMNAGDAIEITFDVNEVPPLPQGWNRSFVLYTNGWLKDGDLNTAKGRTVTPLPFEGMTKYPYGPEEAYPMTSANKTYLESYNTRVVTRDKFRGWIKP